MADWKQGDLVTYVHNNGYGWGIIFRVRKVKGRAGGQLQLEPAWAAGAGHPSEVPYQPKWVPSHSCTKVDIVRLGLMYQNFVKFINDAAATGAV